MRRHVWLRVAVGVLLLALAVGAAFLAHGVGDAASGFRHTQAEWQRGLAETPAPAPGSAQRAGEILLGIDGRSDVLRAYQNYRAGLANVIPGTVYPQTRARYEAISTLRRLRSKLSARDRASADVLLGAIFAAGAASAGPLRSVQTRYAIDAFERAILEDDTNTTAKHDLELLLRSQLNRKRARPQGRASDSPSRKRQNKQNPRGPTAHARAEGTGY